MVGYATEKVKDPKEKEEEESTEGNHKHPARNPVGGSHSWEKESAARARSQRSKNMAGYATGMTNKPEEDEEEENAAGNCKQTARNPVGGSHGRSEERAARARSQRAGNLYGCGVGTANDTKED